MAYESTDKMVSSPSHYCTGGMEVIDVIDNFTAELSGTEAVCTANALKYILRWKKKGGKQDVEKAIWYLTHLKEHLDVVDFVIETGDMIQESEKDYIPMIVAVDLDKKTDQYIAHFEDGSTCPIFRDENNLYYIIFNGEKNYVTNKFEEA